MNTQSYKDLLVWQRAMGVVKQVYSLSAGFPGREIYGITAQLRRAAVSIPANIAEGNARSSRRDYARFLSIARGSLTETETLILISIELGYADITVTHPILQQIDELGRMLRALHNKLSAAASNHPR